MTLDILLSGVTFIAAVWVLGASIWRINLLKWGESQCMQFVAYFAIGVWAADSALGHNNLNWLGVAGVAALFYSGRERWLKKAPDDTARAPR